MNARELKDILVYFCKKYPYKDELSETRITKMVYLADWKYALDYGEEPTGIDWEFNHYGPYVEDVYNCARSNNDTFSVKFAENYYGHPKKMIGVNSEVAEPELPENLRKTLDHIIEITKVLNWNDFIKLVYSTHPIISQDRYTSLDLVALAKEYKNLDDKPQRTEG